MSTPQAFDHVADLVRLLADPTKADATIKEYRSLLQKNTALTAQADKANAEAGKKLDQAHEALEAAKAATAATAAKERDLVNRTMVLDERGRELDEKYRNLVKLQDEHKEAVALKQAELDKRERAVAGLEKDRVKLNEDRRVLDGQLAAARSFLRV